MQREIAAERAGYSPREFAAKFGHHQAWAYRQIYNGKIRVITDFGNMLIPESELERILGSAGRYNPQPEQMANDKAAKEPSSQQKKELVAA